MAAHAGLSAQQHSGPAYVAEPGATAFSLGGLRAWPVRDAREGSHPLIALATQAGSPPRPMLAHAFGVLLPHAVMPRDACPLVDPDGREAWCIVCPPLPGPALALGKPWPEADLLEDVLLPVAAALADFARRGWTHRAIRPDNLFRADAGGAATLGPCWAAPPASLQPPIVEPPASALCHPSARGDGTIADDIYALGVTLLALAAGKMPLAGLDDAAVLHRKLERGSFAALTDGVPLSPLLLDVLRSMLEDDPAHRPAPALLLDPRDLRYRRPLRSPRLSASESLTIDGQPVGGARALAALLGAHPDRAAELLGNGTVQRWLRRSLADSEAAAAIEETVRASRAEPDGPDRSPLLVLRAVARLDPLAPLAWRGLWLFPDGVPASSAAAAAGVMGRDQAVALTEVVEKELCTVWRAVHGRRMAGAPAADGQAGAHDAGEWKRMLWRGGPAGGMRLLAYGTNPFLACLSPLLGGRATVRLAELAPALDAAAAQADTARPPLDAEIAAFVAARGDVALRTAFSGIDSVAHALEDGTLLSLFARLQVETRAPPLPGLARWLLGCGAAALDRVRRRATREALRADLERLAEAGRLAPMVAAVNDDALRRTDAEGARQAGARLHAIEARLAQLGAAGSDREARAPALAFEIVAGGGAFACAVAAFTLLLR